jgi:hypothetical protein
VSPRLASGRPEVNPRSVLLAIDPGPTKSAWLLYVRVAGGWEPRAFSTWPNELVLAGIVDPRRFSTYYLADELVIEKVESFGMAVGAEVFETVYWSGRFHQAALPLPVDRIGRKAVKIHLCGSMRAKDPNIRQALIDRFSTRAQPAIGKKASPGPLYGVSADVWSALAVAVTFADQHA